MRLAPQGVQHIEPLDYGAADGLAAEVIDEMAREFQVVTPITIHMVVPDLLAGLWSVCRETLVAGPLPRARREAVAAAVSSINECPFCVDVHTAMLHASGEHGLADRIRSDHEGDAPELDDTVEVRWARATLTPGHPMLTDPPFAAADAAQLIGVAVSFHYVNRMVNVFLEESPFPVPPVMRGAGTRLFGATLAKRILVESVEPGHFLTPLPDRPLPPEFGWADGDPAVAGAFTRFAAAAEAAGERSLAAKTRAKVTGFLSGWDGSPPPLGLDWVDDALIGLAGADRDAGRLALITAVASYRVDRRVIDPVRRNGADDRHLTEITSWGAYSASRRISSWLHAAARPMSRA